MIEWLKIVTGEFNDWLTMLEWLKIVTGKLYDWLHARVPENSHRQVHWLSYYDRVAENSHRRVQWLAYHARVTENSHRRVQWLTYHARVPENSHTQAQTDHFCSDGVVMVRHTAVDATASLSTSHPTVRLSWKNVGEVSLCVCFKLIITEMIFMKSGIRDLQQKFPTQFSFLSCGSNVTPTLKNI
jgi:hypothetical protein